MKFYVWQGGRVWKSISRGQWEAKKIKKLRRIQNQNKKKQKRTRRKKQKIKN